ncbi:MAG: hypothetical protein J3R72DRAFT_438838 [Linnemannia gamsii]|nr:MAG: hypothetical protein J3R72DRAFT_438838 [Linnemannia gamsii]
MSKSDKDSRPPGADWRSEFDSRRKGAGYFFSQRGRLSFTPSGYIGFRSLDRAHSSSLLQEWDVWIRDLKACTQEHVQRAAKAAPSLTTNDLDQYYRDRIVADRDLEVLANSSCQLKDADLELRLHLQRRRVLDPKSTPPSESPEGSSSPCKNYLERSRRQDPIQSYVDTAMSSTSGAVPLSSPVIPSDAADMTYIADAMGRQIPTKPRKRKQKSPIYEDSNEEAVASNEEYWYSTEEFEAMVAKLDRRHFWKLNSTGQYVEDVLIKAARGACQVQHHVHSLIIHTEDKFTRELFSEDEWLEICTTNWKALPDPSKSILNYLDTFNKGTLEELHAAADAHLPITGPYQHKNHWVFRWIRITVETWLGLYCQDPAPLKSRQQESFYRNDVFGMINSLLRDVEDLVVVHGELTSDDTAERRNGSRALPTDGALERKRMGCRCDGLVQVQGQPPLNIGVLEASKEFDNTGTKFLFDTLKVARELHDMLRNRLRSLHVTTKATELTLVGYVLSGMFRLTYIILPIVSLFRIRLGTHLNLPSICTRTCDDDSVRQLSWRVHRAHPTTPQATQDRRGYFAFQIQSAYPKAPVGNEAGPSEYEDDHARSPIGLG